MPVKFTKKEKEIIRKTLINEGRELFSLYGLRKTSITQLTEAAGIAQGSFYNFFDSKEDLYFEILQMEHEKSENYIENIVKSNKSAKATITEIIKGTNDLFESNHLIRRLYESRDYELMVRKLSPQKLENHQRDDTLMVLNTVIGMQKENELIEARPEIIAGMLRAIAILSFHQDEIGKEIFPEVINLFADVVSEGLVREQDKGVD